MFMGTALLLKKKLLNNDPVFFQKFAARRPILEKALVEHKSMIATILQGYGSRHRVEKYAQFLDNLVERAGTPTAITNDEIVSLSGISGKIIAGQPSSAGASFSDDVKSETFIRKALEGAVKCSICNGYLDPSKSVSYDHVKRKRDGGDGEAQNCDLTHPYCNQSVKN
jgi:hypothetical protein